MTVTDLVLFVSHATRNCGVYQFGYNVANALEQSSSYRFQYVECCNPDDYHAALSKYDPALIIYNYHPSTMPWLRRRVLRGPARHVGIMHEVTQAIADSADDRLFSFHIAPDPTLLLNNPLVFKTGRLLPSYRNAQPLPEVPTIGSFGFGTLGKGFEHLVSRVQQEFDRARIRLLIPCSAFADASGANARSIIANCRRILTKPGIELDARHDFLSQEELLDFLAGNSLNAFLYEEQSGRGVSSVIDYALAVERPIAITRSSMFRHIRDTRPAITVDDARLPELMSRGFRPLARYRAEWTAENLVWDYERIVASLLASSVRKPRRAAILRLRPESPASALLGALDEAGHGLAQRTLPLASRADTLLRASGVGRRLRSITGVHRGLGQRLNHIRSRAAAKAQRADWVPSWSTANAAWRSRKVDPYVPLPQVGPLNRILDPDALALYGPTIDYLFQHLPEIMARKIARANVQQAFVLDTVARLVPDRADSALLAIGSYEDTASAALELSGYHVEEVDPVLNYDLSTYMTKPSCRRSACAAVFATSVLEHVADDARFVQHMQDLLEPGGFGVLTCDFNDAYRPGDPLPAEDRRFYTRRDLLERLLPLIPLCELVDEPQWNCDNPDFSYGGCQYTFASVVFRKKS